MKKNIKLVFILAVLLIASFIVTFIVIEDRNGINSGDIIIGIGDSITAGGKNNDDFHADEEGYLDDLGDGYFKIVADSLDAEIGDLTFYNSARSGITSLGFVSLVNPYCLDYNPDLVILTLGANDFLFDTPESFRDGFFHVTDAIYKKEVNTVVILPFVMDHYLDFPHTDSPKSPDEISDYYDIAVEISDGYGFKTIDIGAIFDGYIANGVDPQELCEDGIHPTGLGEEILAEAILLAVEEF